MPRGYSFLEGLWKRKEKDKFLETQFNSKERYNYRVLFYMNIVGLIVFILLLPYVIYKNHIPNFGWYIVLANLMAGMIRQNYRRIKLIKYGYYRKPTLIKNILQGIFIAFIFIITMLGFLYAVYLISFYIPS